MLYKAMVGPAWAIYMLSIAYVNSSFSRKKRDLKLLSIQKKVTKL